MPKDSNVFLIDHAWTFRLSDAYKQVLSTKFLYFYCILLVKWVQFNAKVFQFWEVSLFIGCFDLLVLLENEPTQRKWYSNCLSSFKIESFEMWWFWEIMIIPWYCFVGTKNLWLKVLLRVLDTQAHLVFLPTDVCLIKFIFWRLQLKILAFILSGLEKFIVFVLGYGFC
jgi:hypothetical protein